MCLNTFSPASGAACGTFRRQRLVGGSILLRMALRFGSLVLFACRVYKGHLFSELAHCDNQADKIMFSLSKSLNTEAQRNEEHIALKQRNPQCKHLDIVVVGKVGMVAKENCGP